MGFGLPLNLKINEFLKLVHKMSKTCSLQGVLFASLVKELGRHPVSTGGDAWYSQSSGFLKIQGYIHSSFEKGASVKRTGNV
jgi:hypothetical protein